MWKVSKWNKNPISEHLPIWWHLEEYEEINYFTQCSSLLTHYNIHHCNNYYYTHQSCNHHYNNHLHSKYLCNKYLFFLTIHSLHNFRNYSYDYKVILYRGNSKLESLNLHPIILLMFSIWLINLILTLLIWEELKTRSKLF